MSQLYITFANIYKFQQYESDSEEDVPKKRSKNLGGGGGGSGGKRRATANEEGNLKEKLLETERRNIMMSRF